MPKTPRNVQNRQRTLLTTEIKTDFGTVLLSHYISLTRMGAGVSFRAIRGPARP